MTGFLIAVAWNGEEFAHERRGWVEQMPSVQREDVKIPLCRRCATPGLGRIEIPPTLPHAR